MQVYLGSDHAGFNLKKQIKDYLAEKFNGKDGYSVLDLGVFTNDATDYPDIAREVCEKVIENNSAMGILICGSGVGMSISANRLKGIRAVLANNEMTAQLSREHNNANVLCMGERMTAFDVAKGIVNTFLETKFDAEERHVRRIGKIETVGYKNVQGGHEEGRC